jgi:hypothetical protein
MTRPQAEPSAQALGESLAALAAQIAALRGQIAQINHRLDQAGLCGDLDLAARRRWRRRVHLRWRPELFGLSLSTRDRKRGLDQRLRPPRIR